MNRSFAKRLQLAAAPLLLALTSCGEGTTAPGEVWLPDVAPPVYAILDAANDGNPHFYFLPPVVPNPSPTGTFDGSLSPRVEICESDLSGCIADPFAVFTSGEGANDVRVVPEDEHYILNYWHTDDWDLTIGSYYRIIVYQASFELGYIDVLVDGQGGGKNARTGDTFQLKEGRTLPLKIRIEEGAAAMAPASASTPDGSATVQAPPGALQNYEQLTVEPVDETTTELPTNGSALPGTIFDFGPDGLEFEEPVELALAYDPATLPMGVVESELRVYLAGPDGWKLLPGGSVDLTTKKVKGLTSHFSSFAILPGRASKCQGSGYGTLEEALADIGPEGTITVCDGTHSVEGVVVNKPVTIRAEAGATPVLQTSVERSALLVDGIESGTVHLDGLTFEYSTQHPAPDGSPAYAIWAEGTYDQLVVESSTFTIAPGSRGSIAALASTVAGAALLVDDIVASGGTFGIAMQNIHAEVTNSHFSNTSFMGVQYASTGSPTNGLIQGSTFDQCGFYCARGWGTEAMDIVGNDFGQCGSARCIGTTNGAQVNIQDNTFVQQILTGDGAPDPNNHVFIAGSVTATVTGNTFNGCAFYNCIEVAGTATVTDNDFHHITGQPEWMYSHVIGAFGSVNAVFDGNRIHSCGVFCYNVGNGANVTIRNETVTVLPGHGTTLVATMHVFDEPTAPANTLVFEDNTVTGSGAEGGVHVWDTNLTLNRNSFNGLTDGILVNQGISYVTTVTGQDNVFGSSGTGVAVQSGTSVDLQFNDFTGQTTGLDSQEPTAVLTCNWWGNVAGPQNVDPSVPSSVFTLWATAPIANGAGGVCDGM